MAPIAAFAIWALAARTLAPLDRLAREVRARDSSSLAPVPVAGLPDEVAPLAGALNALLGRLQSALDTQRAFVADAAHELRSPLTALKLQLRLLARGRPPAPTATPRSRRSPRASTAPPASSSSCWSWRAASPGAPPPALEPIDLAELTREALAATHALALERGSELVLDAEAPVWRRRRARRPVGARPQPGRQRPALFAARLARRRAGLARRGPRSSMLQVDDAGPGIDPADAERIFDRFYRRAAAGEEGSGLGLAIVRSVAQRHGAEVSLGDAPAAACASTCACADGALAAGAPPGARGCATDAPRCALIPA